MPIAVCAGMPPPPMPRPPPPSGPPPPASSTSDAGPPPPQPPPQDSQVRTDTGSHYDTVRMPRWLGNASAIAAKQDLFLYV